ncbi:MAG: RecX family transcriptional regulator [Candidatus Omnitrophica bacterium]|nr:RecX family transcriptional regulator [Candidatus Omnitrophota bacterium]
MSSSKPSADEAQAALAALPRYLRTRVRSAREAADYLIRRGVPPQAALRAVADCRARGLLDDRACARLWAEQWARRGYAASAIRLKLAARGLPDEVIADATRAYGAPADEEARARLAAAAARRRGARQAGLPAAPKKDLTRAAQAGRLARGLAARGFEADLIERIVGESLPS